MTTEEKNEMPSAEQVDSASRRDFMKVAGIGALGLMYSHPVVETLRGGGGHLSNYSGKPQDGSSGNTNHDDYQVDGHRWWYYFFQFFQKWFGG